MSIEIDLNRNALPRCEQLLEQAATSRVTSVTNGAGTRIIDCGVKATGGLEAGRALAEICLAGLAHVQFAPCSSGVWEGPAVAVTTDQPVAACIASQYAGWPVQGDGFFAMASGPMRAARGREPVLEELALLQKTDLAIGVLESGNLPPDEVCRTIAEDCQVDPKNLTLLVAPTASLAGTIQVVARSVETALHKLHEVGFDIRRVISGFGVSPLPPVAANDLAGIGRTNDAMLYGGEVALWVTGDDGSLEQIGPQVPSSASKDYGEPFAKLFARYDNDFYKIDPLLFSPAVVTFVNVETGHTYRFGKLNPEIIQQSFGN